MAWRQLLSSEEFDARETMPAQWETSKLSVGWAGHRSSLEPSVVKASGTHTDFLKICAVCLDHGCVDASSIVEQRRSAK